MEINGVEPPLYDSNELGGIAGTDVRQPFEMREVIARIVDGSRGIIGK